MVLNIVSIIAIIIAPIVSVWIAQRLNEKAAKRKDKMDLFKTLMISRNGWTMESVRALNILEVVFSDDEAVRNAWRKYYDRLCVSETPSDAELKKIQEAQYDLLETMAISLGYKNKITWKTIQNPYVPKWMIEAEKNQRSYQEGQLALADIAKRMAMTNQMPFFQTTEKQSTENKQQE